MSLLNDYREKFVIMSKTRVSDGEGGYVTEWTEGANIYLIQAHNSTIAAQVAEKDSTASTYTFLFDKSLEFDFHDIIKRVSDGQIFRITTPSGEDYTPAMSRLNLGKVLAEKWSIPS